MAVNQDLLGRRFPLPEPYLVGREHVRSFARAILAAHPIHTDLVAARAAGYADLVAPPTFATVLQDLVLQQLLAEPDIGFELHQLVHADQRFDAARPIVAGDELDAALEVTRVRSVGPNTMIQATTAVTDADGGSVVTGTATLLVGAAA